MELLRENTACFTGHRNIPAARRADVTAALYSTVLRLAADGYTDFIAGGAVGFDTMAADCVTGVKERYPSIRLVLALPCRDQTAKWKSADDLEAYKRLLGSADRVEYMSPFYTDECMFERNRFMADHSSVCVAYYGGGRGGTAYTYSYAAKKGLRMINLCPDENGRYSDTNTPYQLSIEEI